MSNFSRGQRAALQLALIRASLVSYLRDGAAIFFTLLFPLVFMVIFGLLNFGGGGSSSEPSVGLVDEAASDASRQFTMTLKADDVPLDITDYATVAEGRAGVADGDVDVLVTIPAGFTLGGDVPSAPAELGLVYQADEFTALSITQAVLDAVLDGIVLTGAPADFIAGNYATLGAPQSVSASGNDVSYRVFLIPGILSMAIMQTGVFGIVFTFVRFKVTGVLRRFQGTPAGITPFLFSEMVSRLIIIVVSTALLMGIGAALFSDYRDFIADGGVLGVLSALLVGMLGGFVFAGYGLAISGRTRSENAAAGIANLSTFPMLFLSGVFFSTSVLPDWLGAISDYLPLTFLIEGMRAVQVDGEVLWSGDVWQSVLGLLAWGAGFFILARLLFRWQ